MYGSSLFWIFAMVGSICGIVSLAKIRRLVEDTEKLKTLLKNIQQSLDKLEHLSLSSEKKSEAPLQSISEFTKPLPVAPIEKITEPSFQTPLPANLKSSSQSFELKLGTRWLNWVGIIMLLAGIAFFLKYAYDNVWIGPKGRLVIGVLLGIIALGFGERFRRRQWPVLFQTFTGGGLAIFYLCVYFSFQVYHFLNQPISMILAIMVTGLAVVMAVSHNALSIAILAVLGGFLSPILLSTGTNQPYALFTYITILDMVALAVAYFRRWRALGLLCFIGTLEMYIVWHSNYYANDQRMPALIFTSIFYLIFLIIPILHSISIRRSEAKEALLLLSLSAFFSFISYYDILFQSHHYVLGFVVIGQALLVFLLFQLWIRRVGMNNNVATCLLTITMGLITVAIPIQLKSYSIPIAWSMEGAVLVLLGLRFQLVICRIAGIVALYLSAMGLLFRLPLHEALFTPIFNTPFASWSFVIFMMALSAFLMHKDPNRPKWHGPFTANSFLLSLFLICVVFSAELSQIWTINYPVPHYRTFRAGTLDILWSLIPVTMILLFIKKSAKIWLRLSWVCYGIGALVVFAGFGYYSYPSRWFVLNAAFLPLLIFVFSLWSGAYLLNRFEPKKGTNLLTLAGHGFLALMIALECARWGQYGDFITAKMGISLISAAWAIQAFGVIWIGLAKRSAHLRYLGFVLFILAVGKTVLIDMSELEKVYRIISFAACGLLLLAAGYFYQRYSAKFLDKSDSENETSPS